MSTNPDDNDKRLDILSSFAGALNKEYIDEMFEDLGPKKMLAKLQSDLEEINDMANPFDKVTRLTILKSAISVLPEKTEKYLVKKAGNADFLPSIAKSAPIYVATSLIGTGLCLFLGFPPLAGFGSLAAGHLLNRVIKEPPFIRRWKEKRINKKLERLEKKWAPFFNEVSQLDNRITNLHCVIMEHPDYAKNENKTVLDRALKRHFPKQGGKPSAPGAAPSNDPKGPDLN